MKKYKVSMMLTLNILTLCLFACIPPLKPLASEPQPLLSSRTEAFTTPHPILSDLRVRRAIAYCVNRDRLIDSLYSFIEDKSLLYRDSFLPKSHWAYSAPKEDYHYDPEKGKALLEEAGWTLTNESYPRVNKQGEGLTLTLVRAHTSIHVSWDSLLQVDLATCGIELNRQGTDAGWFFGETTGLRRREFDLTGFAWSSSAFDRMDERYSCGQIPLPSNNWQGYNVMGWCNQKASETAILADNTLERANYIKTLALLQEYFVEDMISLPLFQSPVAEAWSKNLDGLRADVTEFGTASAENWQRKDGGDTVIIGYTQEPSTLFRLVAGNGDIDQLSIGRLYTGYTYDFQPKLQKELSTLESGLASNGAVTVNTSDKVYSIYGEPEWLQPGTKVMSDHKITTYDGTSPLRMPQLTVTYRLEPYTWSDGVAGSIGDLKLAYQIECAQQAGTIASATCDAIEKIEFSENDLSMRVTYLPGYQNHYYFLFPFLQVYPSHQVISDGRQLKDIPAAEWASLPEIAEKPLSYGPFMVTNWSKGTQLTLEANPYYAAGTGVKKIIVRFISDTEQAIRELLSGDIDYLGKDTIGTALYVLVLSDEAHNRRVNLEIFPSRNWTHLDMNLNVK